MTDGAWGLAPTCSTEDEHEFAIELGLAGAVAGLTVHCPNCAGALPPTPIRELAEMLAARRRTLAGIAALPEPTRAGLVASGVLAQLCAAALADVEDTVRRCRPQIVTEPPEIWTAGAVDVDQLVVVLAAVARWLSGAPRVVHIPRQRSG
ncbi:MAG TPA: hypothetical protein VFE65_34995 [Pseudonocardia sp.]|jgi:AcrR family transcriptional regulator|nr:hypothetical protein [Pseudonocardia sp.]